MVRDRTGARPTQPATATQPSRLVLTRLERRPWDGGPLGVRTGESATFEERLDAVTSGVDFAGIEERAELPAKRCRRAVLQRGLDATQPGNLFRLERLAFPGPEQGAELRDGGKR